MGDEMTVPVTSADALRVLQDFAIHGLPRDKHNINVEFWEELSGQRLAMANRGGANTIFPLVPSGC